MKYLVVVAHPDDEILGAGASIFKWTSQGDNVFVLVLCSQVDKRNNRPSENELSLDVLNANKIIGVTNIFKRDFKNLALNSTPHFEIVEAIEEVINEVEPDIVITHHPSDLNIDHFVVSLACNAASKLFVRKPNIKPIKKVLYMEVLSSTDWNINPAYSVFNPNYFVEVGEKAIQAKIDSLAQYIGVMRDYPHSRSKESLMALATIRGSQSGEMYAEAFQIGFERD